MCTVYKNLPHTKCSGWDDCLSLTAPGGDVAVRLGPSLQCTTRGLRCLLSGIQVKPVVDWSPPAGRESSRLEHIVHEASFFSSSFPCVPTPFNPPQPDRPLQSISKFLDERENNRWDQSRWPCKLSLCYIYANERHWWKSRYWNVKEKWTASKMIRLGNEPEPECPPGRCYTSDSLWQLQN